MDDSSLVVRGNLSRTDLLSFEKACCTLCSSPRSAAVLDLTHCTHLNSMFVGALVDAVMRMQAHGKAVVIRVSPELGVFLNMAHLYHLLNYELAEPPAVSG